MKDIFKWMVLILVAGSFAHATERQPNILMILSDDQGYGDFGFTGNEVVDTAALDRLSEESAFYPYLMVGPACTPTRSALLTGRNHLDTGVWGVGARGKVRRDETLMPKFFSPSGYKNWVFGKLDGGITMMEMTPIDRGFDYFCGIGGGYLQERPLLITPEGGEWTEGWSAELITDLAIEKIREAGDEPWMAHMNYIIPHIPWLCPDSYADVYRKQGYSEDIAQCYGSIKQMDDQIGRLLDALKDAGQAENTIVLFMSDNGSLDAVNNIEVGPWENAKNKAPHSPDWKYRNPDNLIGRKGEVWDNGIRSPLLVRWPGKIKPGIRKHAIGVEDVLPTLLELAKIPESKWPEHYPFSGKSFSASLKDRTFTDERDIFRLASGGPGVPVGISGNTPHPKTLKYSTLHTILRSGKFKFHHLPGGVFRLYDMENDQGEVNDLSKKMPERTGAMASRCREQWNAIASGDRTFPMRQLMINNADRPGNLWKIQVLQPLLLTGDDMYMHDYLGGVKGFQFPGDRADYAVEVQKALSVSVVIEGENFDQCAPISLLVDNKTAKVKSRSVGKIEYGPVRLKSGTNPLSLTVADIASPGKGVGEVLKMTLKLEK